MALNPGTLFAFVALLFWGFGDFLISRSTKRFGDWETLLAITGFGAIALTPFVWAELPALASFPPSFWVLFGGALVIFFGALLDFEALRRGKLSIVEPVLSLEVPFTVLLAFIVLGETLTMEQGALICLVLLGLLLVSLKRPRITRKMLEKGVAIGAGGAVLMGGANFLVGYGARISSPLLVNWVMCVFITVACVAYLAMTGRFRGFLSHLRRERRLFATMAFLDNGAWIAFAFAVSLAPMGVVLAISESYIALTVLLGLVINKERIHGHQKAGLAIAVAGVVLLATL